MFGFETKCLFISELTKILELPKYQFNMFFQTFGIIFQILEPYMGSICFVKEHPPWACMQGCANGCDMAHALVDY